MSRVLSQRTKPGRGKTLAPRYKPISLHFASGRFATATFSNDQTAQASCLRCPDTPCATFADREMVIKNFDRFPADRLPTVCAANAIRVPEELEAPSIDGDRCMMCGVCASRCPAGAIRLVPGKGAQVNDAPNSAFVETEDVSVKRHTATVSLFDDASENGTLLAESDVVVDDAFARLQEAWGRVGDQFPNVLVRNLLIGAGVGAAIGRKGNIHMRMDLILGPPGVIHGVAEVEFGQDAVLDGPRDIMDAMAVLVSRYRWKRKELVALVVSDVLPNRRSEYWSIVQDIRKVLGIEIGTVTVLALMVLNWNRRLLNFSKGQAFYADRDTKSYREKILETVVGHALKLGRGPRPQVDIAK